MWVGESNVLIDASLNTGLRAKLRRLLRQTLCGLFGRKFYYRHWFRRRHGYYPNLRKPVGYNEKLLWLALNADLEALSPFTDKWSVRRYVADRIGTSFLVPTYTVVRNLTQIPPLESLPNEFIMKATHGSHMTLIVKDKSQLPETTYRALCHRWLNTSYYVLTGEQVYKRCAPGILIEQLLHPSGGSLLDYKFLCYQGEPCFIDVHGDRFGVHRENYYTVDWTPLPIRQSLPDFEEPLLRPHELGQMIEVARVLSCEFTFVRVDLYAFDGQVYFGELTFIPANARSPIRPRDYEFFLGERIPLRRNIWVPQRSYKPG